MKPDPPIYHAVCAQLGVVPEDAVLLDDVAENIVGARAVGMRGVTFLNTEQAIAELAAQLDRPAEGWSGEGVTPTR